MEEHFTMVGQPDESVALADEQLRDSSRRRDAAPFGRLRCRRNGASRCLSRRVKVLRHDLPAWFGTATRAAAAAVTTATATAGSLRARLVDRKIASAELLRIEVIDGFLRLGIAAHLDEPEATGTARHLIAHHRDRLDRSDLREQRLKVGFADFEGQVSDKELSTHNYYSSIALSDDSTAGMAWVDIVS